MLDLCLVTNTTYLCDSSALNKSHCRKIYWSLIWKHFAITYSPGEHVRDSCLLETEVKIYQYARNTVTNFLFVVVVLSVISGLMWLSFPELSLLVGKRYLHLRIPIKVSNVLSRYKWLYSFVVMCVAMDPYYFIDKIMINRFSGIPLI